MNSNRNLLLHIMVVVVISFSFFIVFGDNGMVELRMKQAQRDTMIEKNDGLIQENLDLYRTIKRLDDDFSESDLKYIECLARRELGVVGRNELIFKFTRTKFANTEQTGVERERAEF